MKKLLWSVTLISTLLFLTCSADKNLSRRYEIEKAYQLGEQFRENLYINLQAATPEDYQKAIVYYQAVKEQSPFPKSLSETDSLNQDQKEILDYTKLSYIRISELLMNQKKFDQALSEANRYLADFSVNDLNRQMMHLRKGQIYELKQLPDSALVEYEQVLDEYLQNHERDKPATDLVRLPFYVIALYANQEDFNPEHISRAAGFYKKLIASPPDDQLSQLATQSLADLYLRDKKFEQCIATLETLVDSTGKIYPRVLLGIADLYLAVKQDYPKAREVFHQFVELYPKDDLAPFAQFGVGKAYYEEKKYQKALDVFSRVKQDYSANPRAVPATQFQIGLSYYRMGDWDRAKTELDWLILNYPESPEGMKAVVFVADYFRQQKNQKLSQTYLDKAIAQYKQIIARDPKTPQAFAANQLLTEVYVTLKRWEEAAGQLEEFMKSTPNDPAHAEILLLLGQLYEEKLKNLLKANQTYAQFMMKFPQDPRAKEALEKAKKLSLQMQGGK